MPANATDEDLTHRYLWGTAVDQILADEQVHWDDTPGQEGYVTDDLLWPLGDHLGSLRDVIDSAGVVRIHRVYDAFGKITSTELRNAGNQVVTPDQPGALLELLAFTARPFDADTLLQNNLHRWYDPSTGRWLSEDPIGFKAGDANLYRYVGNTPTMSIDPLGLWRRVGATRYASEGGEDSLPSLAAERTGDWEDWVCLWPIVTGRNRAAWMRGYPYSPPKGCVVDASNLMASHRKNPVQGAMRAPYEFDDQAKIKELALNQGGHVLRQGSSVNDKGYPALASIFDAFGASTWTSGPNAARLVAGLAGLGKTPITRLYIAGHHWPAGSGVFYSQTVQNANFSFAHIAQLANQLGVGDNFNNTLEKAAKREGPPRCWFSRDAKVYGLGCVTGQGGNSWAKQWFDGIGSQRGSFFGTRDLLNGSYTQMIARRADIVRGIQQYSLHVFGARLWVGNNVQKAITSLPQVSQWEGTDLIRVGRP